MFTLVLKWLGIFLPIGRFSVRILLCACVIKLALSLQMKSYMSFIRSVEYSVQWS